MNLILIVEDEVSTRMALTDQLETIGSLKIASNVREALAMFKRHTFDLVVVDLQLPGKVGIEHDAGFQILEFLQQKARQSPVIVLTIRNDNHAIQRARQFSFVRFYISKPWNDKELKRCARKCLTNKANGFTLIDVKGESND